jgi:hypothetical protein
VFELARPAIGKSTIGTATLENGGAAVVAVTSVRLDPNSQAQMQLAQQREIMGRQGQGEAIAYLEELRRTADVSKNPKAFE